jgi:dienelactone hydrolase
MAEVVLFHHAQGLTPGCHAFADELRAAGHVVHVPDLYEGETFHDLDEGVAHAKGVGFDTIRERGRRAAESLSSEIVYAGFSLGAMSAQMLAQTRRGAKGALIIHAAMQPAEFGGPWPKGLPLQIHTMEDDSWGDPDVAKELSESLAEAEVFLYPGDTHLFTDNSLSDYDEAAATLVTQRVLAFLDGIET